MSQGKVEEHICTKLIYIISIEYHNNTFSVQVMTV